MDQIMNLLTQNVSDKASATIEIMFMLTVSFMIGVFMVWAYHKIKMAMAKKKISKLNADILLQQEEFKRIKHEKDKINFSYKTLTEDNNKLMSDHKQLKKENDKLKEQLNLERQKPIMSAGQHKEEMKKLSTINERLEGEVRDLNKQVQRLKDDNDYMKSQEKRAKEGSSEEVNEIRHELHLEKQKNITELRELRREVQRNKVEKEKALRELDLALLNSQIVKEENERIKAERDRIKFESDKLRADTYRVVKTEHKKLEEKEEEFERKKRLLLESIGIVAESEKEDLKQIRGIGPFIEKKLHQIGVYTIQQIANFTKDDIVRATELIKYFPGRIERDQWIFQAHEMIRVRDKNLELIKKFEK